jgi:hypothetical protein
MNETDVLLKQRCCALRKLCRPRGGPDNALGTHAAVTEQFSEQRLDEGTGGPLAMPTGRNTKFVA